jgi:FMN phosphatase YigB (HAD superfamily)
MKSTKFKLLVTDIDNTLFDWVSYYVHSLEALFAYVSKVIDVPVETLRKEAQQIFTAHASIEYPFLTQEMPSVMKHYGNDIDLMLSETVEPSRNVFKKEAEKWLVPFEGVAETLKHVSEQWPGLSIIALTDAPRYVAMWKLNKLGILNYFDAVYGLADPRLPTDPKLGRVKVSPKILLKHLQQSNFDFKGKIRILPDDYEKPGVKGLKTVLMDYEIDDAKSKHEHVIWVGDNLRKDVKLGETLGVTTVWAEYGTHIDKNCLDKLATFSPPLNVAKNVPLKSNDPDAPKVDHVLKKFSELVKCL